MHPSFRLVLDLSFYRLLLKKMIEITFPRHSMERDKFVYTLIQRIVKKCLDPGQSSRDDSDDISILPHRSYEKWKSTLGNEKCLLLSRSTPGSQNQSPRAKRLFRSNVSKRYGDDEGKIIRFFLGVFARSLERRNGKLLKSRLRPRR